MAIGVVASLHNFEADRCVDIIKQPSGAFSFSEFRRDPEDGGGWMLVSDYGHLCFATEGEAVTAAKTTVAWLRESKPPAETTLAIPSVLATLHNEYADRCVKIVKRSVASFGFQEFRRDPEDAGGWTLVSDAPGAAYATQEQATAAARESFPWLARMPSDSSKETS